MPYSPRTYPLVDLPAHRAPDPLQSLASMMSLAATAEEYSAQRKQRQTQQRMEQAINAAKGDPMKAADVLETQHGDFVTGRALRDKATEIRRQTLDQIGQRVDAHKTLLGQGGQLLKETEENPTLWPEMRGRVVDLATQLDPRLAGEIPEQYDPERVRGMLQFVEGGITDLSAKDQALKKLKAGYDMTDDALKRDKLYRESAAHWLSTAKTPEEWTQGIEYGASMGIPATILQEFGDWSPDAPKRASEMLLTPEQRAVAARAKIDDDRADKTADATAKYRAAQLALGRQREARLSRQERDSTTPTGRATAERWKASQLDTLESEFTSGTSAMTEPDLRRRQLQIENSYRAQIGLKPLRTLPKEWGVPATETDPVDADASVSALAPGTTQIVEQNGVRYEVTTDASGNVLTSKPVQ